MANPSIESDWVTEPQVSSESDWVDETPADQPVQKSSPGIFDSIGKVSKMYTESPGYSTSPMGLAVKAGDAFSSIFNKAGEKTSEFLGEKQVNPYAAALAGTAVSMAPDLMLAGYQPIAKAGPAVKSAVPFARRALGFQKSMLKTPFARGQATKAAETALENNVIPFSGNPETALDNATALSNKAGAKIGSILKKTPADLNSTFDNLETLRNSLTQGTRDGIYSGVHKAIDEVQTSIAALTNTAGKKSAQDINKIKTRIGNSLNYLADATSQADNKAIVNNLANTVRDLVKKHTSPEEFSDFVKNQRIFSSSKLMEKGLNNEVAGQMGNKMFSPYSVIPAAGEIAAGNPAAAAGTLGLTEGLMRRGAGTAARGIQDIGTNAPAVANLAVNTGAALTRAPYGEKVRQDGKIYKWNGSEYIEE